MLQVAVLRQLLVAGKPHGPPHLSAASGLVRIGHRLYVVADDEHSLGVFDLSSDAPGTLLRIFAGELPTDHRRRKAAKPDLEALTLLPSMVGYPFGALMAFGSGSRPNRERAVLIGLDEQGSVAGPVRHVDLHALLAPLRDSFADLNIEGAFVVGDDLCLLHRGNQASPTNACFKFRWEGVARWLASSGPPPVASTTAQFDLGRVDGVPLCITDGAALPGGSWAFCAAAEDTSDSYSDGRCTGSAVGVVDADGVIQVLEPLSLGCKVEGISASLDDGRIQLLMVTDGDDRRAPALLLSGTMLPAWSPPPGRSASGRPS